MQTVNLDIYGNAPLDWSRALAALAAPPERLTWWLGTTRPDGRPHTAGVGAFWLQDKLYFTSGPGTQKSRNLAANPNSVASAVLTDIDLVLEGAATPVTDEPTVAKLAELYSAQGWPATADGAVITAPYSAPSAGPAPWHVYELVPASAIGVATTEPYGATKWHFD